uniref:Abundant larval transcript 1 n=1 Tax=Onchocerca ochengi TaxID=42157 RepID=B2D1W8_ONCOC|nr:abundant larval transcript 1 [Onchocerca ochengi]
MTTKFLIAFGLVILLSIPHCAAEEDFEEEGEGEEMPEDDDDAQPEDIDGGDEEGGNDENEDVPRGSFVNSMGTKKQCKEHPDCYDQREPGDWCILKPDEKWTNRGCFCSSKGECTIERQKGDGFEHTYCSPDENWTCKYD